jgi:hypothetical protein
MAHKNLSIGQKIRRATAVLELWQRAQTLANILARFDGITNKICLYNTQHTGALARNLFETCIKASRASESSIKLDCLSRARIMPKIYHARALSK